MGDQPCPTYAVGKPTLRQETPFRDRNTEIILEEEAFNLYYEMLLSEIPTSIK